MIGILLMSHGKFAEGALDSLNLFMGGSLEKVEALCLGYGDKPEEYEEKIKEAIARLDDGSGVIGLCDLAGGTPGNICTKLINDRFKVALGFNIGVGLELVGKRFGANDVSEIDMNEVIDICKDRMVYLNDFMSDCDE